MSNTYQASFQQGVANYAGTQDTMLRAYKPTNEYGSSSTLNADAEDGAAGKQTQTLLRFDQIFGTGAGQIPLGATITSATLTLSTSSTGSGASLHRMLKSWSESSTWSSLGGGIQKDGLEAVATADLVTGKIDSTGARLFDVTKSLQAWSNGAGNLGWAFLPSGKDGWDFRSSEGSVKPLLKVTYTLDDAPAPNPTPTPPPTPTNPPLSNPSGDTFNATEKKDTFVIPSNNGRDWINNFNDTGNSLTDDVLDLRAYRFGSIKEIGVTSSGADLVLDFSNSWTPIRDQAQQAAGGFTDGPPATLVTPSSSFSDVSIQKSPSGTIYRFGSREGENRTNDSATSDRTELKQQVKYPVGSDVWISYAFMVEKQKSGEPDYTYVGNNGTSGTHLGQYHGGDGSPIVTMELVDNDTFEIWTRPDAPNTPSSDASKEIRYHTDSFKRGEWYDMVMHIKTAPDAKGSIFDVWMDGQQVLDLSNIPFGYDNTDANNWLWGVYRRVNDIPLDVQYANMEVGTKDLSHRIKNPLQVNFGPHDFDGTNTLTLKNYLSTHTISQIYDNILL